MLAAHEFWHHARRQAPEAQTNTFGSNRKSAEHDCEMVASDAVIEFRKERHNIDSRLIVIATRSEATNSRGQQRKAAMRSPEAKLQKAERYLAIWQRKARAAANKVKRYERSLQALLRSLEKQKFQEIMNNNHATGQQCSEGAIESPVPEMSYG
jgi:hypothetical protein